MHLIGILFEKLIFSGIFEVNVIILSRYGYTVKFGRSNSPVSNTRDRPNSFVGPSNFPIHLMLKYTPGSNSDGSNSKHGPQGDFFM